MAKAKAKLGSKYVAPKAKFGLAAGAKKAAPKGKAAPKKKKK